MREKQNTSTDQPAPPQQPSGPADNRQPRIKHRRWILAVITIFALLAIPQLLFMGPSFFFGWIGGDNSRQEEAIEASIKEVGFQGVLQDPQNNSGPIEYTSKKDYSAATVFAYGKDPLPEYVVDVLCAPNPQDSKSFNYVPTWYREQAAKYKVDFNLHHQCYKQQIQLPDKFLWDESKGSPLTCSNGRSEPILNTDELISYIKNANPELQKYDFLNISLLANQTNSLKDYCDFARVKANTTFVFLQKQPETQDENTYYPSVFSRYLPAIFAHELGHLLGAKDKYTDTNDCAIDDTTGQKYSSLDIMCHSRSLQSTSNYKAIVTDPTAREFGWLN